MMMIFDAERRTDPDAGQILRITKIAQGERGLPQKDY
jgi:hypothetical protein